MSDPACPEILHFSAPDGYLLSGYYWPGGATPLGSVLISPATGVAARYYQRYGSYLAAAGFRVLVYDYRGIGLSRPPRLRGFRASKLDWGRFDCEAALQTLHQRGPDLPLYTVCHSIGGFAFGLAASNHLVSRALFVGCQYAYWRDYARAACPGYWLRWHVLMPLLAGTLGYFPGKRLGWLEDLPQGVALEWGLRLHPQFYRLYRLFPHAEALPDAQDLLQRFTRFQGDLLALADTGDEYATPQASQRLLSHFTQANWQFAQIAPQQESLPQLGHFGFFHDRFKPSLWAESLDWLQAGKIRRTPCYQHQP
jgi:predicted alpha/beta hydrolase